MKSDYDLDRDVERAREHAFDPERGVEPEPPAPLARWQEEAIARWYEARYGKKVTDV